MPYSENTHTERKRDKRERETSEKERQARKRDKRERETSEKERQARKNLVNGPGSGTLLICYVLLIVVLLLSCGCNVAPSALLLRLQSPVLGRLPPRDTSSVSHVLRPLLFQIFESPEVGQEAPQSQTRLNADPRVEVFIARCTYGHLEPLENVTVRDVSVQIVDALLCLVQRQRFGVLPGARPGICRAHD